MSAPKPATIPIIGAGLTGSLLSLYLLRRGYNVDLFEKRGDPRTSDTYSGRSINLALARRGRHALDRVGLLEQVEPHLIPMRGRMIHPREGDRRLQAYGQNEREVIYSVHRATLNQLLLNAAAEHDGFRIYPHHKLLAIDIDAGHLEFLDTLDDSTTTYRCDAPIFGADGAGSMTRRLLEAHTGASSRVEFLDHEYKELSIPPADGKHAFDPEALHIWPRGGFMQIALPNQDGSFTNTLFIDKTRLRSLTEPERASAFLLEEFPDLQPWNQLHAGELINHPAGLLGTVYCPKWHIDDKVVLVGDAAHAIVPFHGQGMNCCFEDCAILAELLDEDRPNWGDVFSAFQRRRQPNTDAIAQMALENYEEMRSDVINPDYVLQRELELELERRFPDHFVPRYSLVMFHRVGYAEALRRGDIQRDILEALTVNCDSLEGVDFDRAARLVKSRLDQ